jgi:hypothetical protein
MERGDNAFPLLAEADSDSGHAGTHASAEDELRTGASAKSHFFGEAASGNGSRFCLLLQGA